MSFRPSDCAIPQLWCGEGKMPKNTNEVRYLRAGTPHECMKKGFGAGMYSEKAKRLPSYSLQKIKYVGETHEDNFKKEGIKTTQDLITKMRGKTTAQISTILRKVLVMKNGRTDMRAFNSVLLFLHGAAVTGLPKCEKIDQ